MTEEARINPWAAIIGPCYTASSLARTLGWNEALIVEAAASHHVLELETSDGRLLYPAFQVWDGRVVDGLGAVLHALSAGTSSRWTWAQWLNTATDDDSGENAPSAIEQLRAGQLDIVLCDARHAAAAWSA
ncbi:hypothetical protein [Microbacterium sp. GbtcB4]|uniref:hypothetical protein n=1 Tax=Microbacterium sp. GbtcB4 TaxID=2824749 RepID=UPI001C2FA810